MKALSALRVLGGLAFAPALVACSPDALLGKGGACHGLADCQPGLVCVDRRCTDDSASLLGETPAYGPDAGSGASMGDVSLDGGATAMGASARDASAARAVDAQVSAVDAFVPSVDNGAPDAGRGRVDAGAPAVDAGHQAVDAGHQPVDAGQAVDAAASQGDASDAG